MTKKISEASPEEYVYDEVRGAATKKTVLSALNKTKLSKFEMDDIFLDV